MWLCGTAASDDPKTFGAPDADSMAGAWTSWLFAGRHVISSLTSRGNQTMFYLGPATAVRVTLIRALPGSIYRHKEHKPFAVQ
ncbi:MAG: hypothetical protein ACT4O2_04580 [Beijerinckiaceae bacterium]